MSSLRILFIGGNGIISSACSHLAVERGYDLTLLNRGTDTTRPAPGGVKSLIGDAQNPASLRTAVGGRDYDVVVNFQSFLPRQAASDIELFTGRIGQYVHISSASAYQKPVSRLPITESTPLKNPWWQYSRDKIDTERVLSEAYQHTGFPVTVVRPSHTYDRTQIPMEGGWTIVDRMRRGRKTVIHGDGTSLWTLTHSDDFAVALVGLLGNPASLGEVFHITSDEVLTWDSIATILAHMAGVEADIVHIASEEIARSIPEWRSPLLGDKSHSVIFDNTKVKRLVPEYCASIPFWRGAREIIEWYDRNPLFQVVNADLDAKLEKLLESRR